MRYKIIIVDDENIVRESLDFYLSSEGHTCRQADNGAQALRLLETESFDAVVTDVMMPEMDGIAMLNELSRRQFRQPVLIMTGGGIIDSRKEAFRAGAQGFVWKPFSLSEFCEEFHRMMQEYISEDRRQLIVNGEQRSVNSN